jgi:D-alanyl-lipoteichoic acid acyltransferase DltB (MBOAT superfamily)
MVFTSVTFAFFLPLLFILYWAIPKKLRWVVLLAANILFYMYGGPVYILLMLAIALVTWLCGYRIGYGGAKEGSRSSKYLLSAAVVVVLGFLAFFKYADFAIGTVSSIWSMLSIGFSPSTLKLALPLGISFYSFAAIGYVVDVYKGKITAEKNFLKYLTFVSFFPSVLSGPINRAGDIMPQINDPADFDYDLAVTGLRQMLWGFFKKLIIADTLTLYVDPIFNNVRFYFGFTLVMSTILYTFQIYCDFSGYSDIAIGTARLLGIDLKENFRSPYYSRSIKEFWSRWHISLSTWFRDYVYIPLGGNRVSKPRQYWNLMVTFLTSGLWHGANWTFVLWGGLHGAVQAVEKMLGIRTYKKRNAIWLFRCFLVFLFATVAWVFFRANTIGDAFYLLTHFLTGLSSPATYLRTGFKAVGMTSGALANCVLFLIPLCWYDLVSGLRDRDAREVLSEKKAWVQWLVYLVIGLYVVFLSQKGVAAEFVYMQF